MWGRQQEQQTAGQLWWVGGEETGAPRQVGQSPSGGGEGGGGLAECIVLDEMKGFWRM
ncbi:conserved hypothetical protein [Ricinus communis]|uniref:Uncharacterized protein n=1 Tax=Ricinus communis TaxID=3988 RepID=B9T671_RICCO|nr:conserved hypothetical protein [Ricinus communis]